MAFDITSYVLGKKSGGGGGGSSDVSTAEVTITYNGSRESLEFQCPNAVEANGIWEGQPALVCGSVFLARNESKTVKVVLYKGTGLAYGEAVVTGSITTDEYGDIFITGNGTITIS